MAYLHTLPSRIQCLTVIIKLNNKLIKLYLLLKKGKEGATNLFFVRTTEMTSKTQLLTFLIFFVEEHLMKAELA